MALMFSLGPCGRARLPFFHVGRSAAKAAPGGPSYLTKVVRLLTRCVLSNEDVTSSPGGTRSVTSLWIRFSQEHSNVYWSFKRSDRSNEVLVQTSKRPPNRRSRYALDKARNSG